MEKFDFFLTQYLSIAVSVALVVFHLLSSMYVSDRMTENVNQEIYVKESEIISNVEKTYSGDTEVYSINQSTLETSQMY